MKYQIIGLLYLIAFTQAQFCYGQEEADTALSSNRWDYELKPMVINYGSADRLRYIRAWIVVRCSSQEAFSAIRDHRHLLRNHMLLSLAKQTEETMSSAEGRELLRLSMLDTIQVLINEQEELAEGIDEVLFQQFLVQ